MIIPIVEANGCRKAGTLTKYGYKAYQGSATIVRDTGIHVTEIFRNTFALFNPCLDMVKGCSSIVMYPANFTYDMVAGSKYKGKRYSKKSGQKIPKSKKSKASKNR
jgi:hypothetical protein